MSQTAGDVQLVHNLVSRYLKNPRSIILAVVSAKNDIGNQVILRNARVVDPQGQRTLGIITKPDLLVRGSKSEEAFIGLARNEDVKFSLGWHVVRNLDSAVTQNQQEGLRDQQESLFFQMSGFSRLPAQTVGIAFLRARLSKVLFNQIRRELPRLVEDIQAEISAARISRDKLGPSRSEPEQQQDFLISGDANPEKRLCAKVMNMHFEFASNIRRDGATWLVGDKDASREKHRTREEAIKDACMLLKKSRGRELPGLPNPLLVGELFRQYSRPWGDLARLHIKEVWDAASRFLELLLRHLTDEEVCENIFAFWLHPIMEEKLNLAYAKNDELLEVHKDHPMTTNTHFITRSRNPRNDTKIKKLALMLHDRLQDGDDSMDDDDVDQMLSDIRQKADLDLDMDMVAAEEAFENMNAYYEVALNLFTDNVPTLAIQAPIIREVPKIFCPTAVRTMDPSVVRRIAGETEEKIMERDSILRRLATLEKGAVICKQYAKRPQRDVNVPADKLDLSSLSLSGSETPANKGKNVAVDTLSIQQSLPAPAPNTASIPGPSSQLLVPSQTGNESRTGPPTPFFTQQNRTTSPSPKPESKTPTPQPVGLNSANAGSDGGLLGSNLGPAATASSANSASSALFPPLGKPASGTNTFATAAAQAPGGIFGAATPSPPSGGLFGSMPNQASGAGFSATAAQTPSSGGLFGSKSSPAFGTSASGTASQTSAFGSFRGFNFGNATSTNTTGSPMPKDKSVATSSSSSTPTPNKGFGNTSTATAGSTLGTFGASSFGTGAARNDNSLK